MCLWTGRGATDVGIRNWRAATPLSETRGLYEVSAAGDSDGDAKAVVAAPRASQSRTRRQTRGKIRQECHPATRACPEGTVARTLRRGMRASFRGQK